MKIYRLDKDVDNFRSCFIKETSLEKQELHSFNKGEAFSLGKNKIEFFFDKERDYPIGNVFNCWDTNVFLVDKTSIIYFRK